MKRKNKNNGITLIALIITIIVMLILVGVSISMVVNGGLFEYAGKAVGDTEEAKKKEEEIAEGKIEVGGVLYNSIDDYLNNNPAAVHNWTEKDVDTFYCSHCEKEYTMGETVDLGTITLGTTEYDESKLISKSPLDTETSLTTDKYNVTGEEVTWVVLGIEDTDNDGIKETLLVTSSEPVGLKKVINGYYGNVSEDVMNVRMQGAAAYNNVASYKDGTGKKVEGELDRICRGIYSNTYGEARSMTIEDVNSALGYTPTGGMYFDGTTGTWKYAKEMLSDEIKEKIENEEISEKKGFDVTVGELSIWDKIKNTGIYVPTENGKQDEDALKATKVDGYYYYLNNDGTKLVEGTGEELDGTVTTKEKKIIFGENTNYFYCLASRGVNVYENSSNAYADFGPGYVYGGNAVSYYGNFGSDGGVFYFELDLRPVVSLKSKLPEVSK